VEEVAAEQHDVGAVLGREAEDLVEGRERVVLADLVLLPGAEVVVGGDENAEDAVVAVVGEGGGGAAGVFVFVVFPRRREVERGSRGFDEGRKEKKKLTCR